MGTRASGARSLTLSFIGGLAAQSSLGRNRAKNHARQGGRYLVVRFGDLP
ncbi:MAG: hypothetical protein IPP91_03715 [Betaproteobacteria bacterium]|nr:hypothetical protein [Betaproteobacteria bacterium]